MKKLLFIIAVIPFLFADCGKNTSPYIPPEPECISDCDTLKAKLQLVWQEALFPDSSAIASFEPITHNNNVLFSEHFNADGEKMNMLDGKTGEFVWTWNDYFGKEHLTSSGKYRVNDLLLFTTWHNTYAIDLNDGTTLWKNKLAKGSGHPRISVFGDWVFHSHNSDRTINEYSHLVKANIYEGVWDTIFSLYKEDGYSPDIYPPSVWKNEKEEEILVFQNRSYNWSNRKSQIDLYAYNMIQDTILWTKNSETALPPLIEGDKIYYLADRIVYCIDKFTGEVLWQVGPSDPEQFHSSNLLLEDGILVINPVNKVLYAVNAETGALLWEDKDSGSSCSDMVYHDGLVYFVSRGRARIYAVDLHTGEHIWAERSPNRAKERFWNANLGYGGIAINADLGYVYSSDFYFAMCFKLAER